MLQPIILYRHEGKLYLLDGRNRRKAEIAAGYKFSVKDFLLFIGDEAAAVRYVEAVNGHRRHMTQEQKEARVLRLIAKYPRLSSRKLALIAGISHTKICICANRRRRTPPKRHLSERGLMRPSPRKSSSCRRSRSIWTKCSNGVWGSGSSAPPLARCKQIYK